jgi:hypothetical protein
MSTRSIQGDLNARRCILCSLIALNRPGAQSDQSKERRALLGPQSIQRRNAARPKLRRQALLQPLEYRRDALAAANAHRHQCVAAPGAVQLVDRLGGQEGT